MSRTVVAGLIVGLVGACSGSEESRGGGAKEPQAAPARPETREVEVSGAKLEVSDTGDGPAIIFIHGSVLCDPFKVVAKEPALEGFRAITYRRRGFGGRPTGPASMQDQAADAATILDELGVKKAHVVGHSFGGAVALQLALDRPDLIATLSLLEAPALGAVPSGPKLMEGMKTVGAAYQKGDKEGALKTFLGAVGGPNYRADVDGKLPPGSYDLALADLDTFFQVEFPALGQWKFGPDEAKNIKAPVLFVFGSDSLPAFKEAADVFEKWMPQTRRLEIPGANHHFPFTHSAPLAEGLVAFLRSNSK